VCKWHLFISHTWMWTWGVLILTDWINTAWLMMLQCKVGIGDSVKCCWSIPFLFGSDSFNDHFTQQRAGACGMPASVHVFLFCAENWQPCCMHAHFPSWFVPCASYTVPLQFSLLIIEGWCFRWCWSHYPGNSEHIRNSALIVPVLNSIWLKLDNLTGQNF
jgi:hypothetical protein